DVDESAKVLEQSVERSILQTIRAGVLGERRYPAFEPLDSACQPRVLPRGLCDDDDDLTGLPRRLLRTAAESGPGRGARVSRSKNRVEGCGEQVAGRRRSQHRMDAEKVVVHPGAVHADDVPERLFHARQPMARDAERAAEIAEVVVVAEARDRVEQRRDRLREVLVDVGVRPANLRALSGRRGDRPRLKKPELTILVDRPLDVLLRSERPFHAHRRAYELFGLAIA